MSRTLYWSLFLGCSAVVGLFSRPAWEVLSTTSLPHEVRAARPSGVQPVLMQVRYMGDEVAPSRSPLLVQWGGTDADPIETEKETRY